MPGKDGEKKNQTTLKVTFEGGEENGLANFSYIDGS